MPNKGDKRIMKVLGNVPTRLLNSYPEHLGEPVFIEYGIDGKVTSMKVTGYETQVWNGKDWVTSEQT